MSLASRQQIFPPTSSQISDANRPLPTLHTQQLQIEAHLVQLGRRLAWAGSILIWNYGRFGGAVVFIFDQAE
jgi:hypothetical protein